MLLKAGVSPLSVALYPLRRRLGKRRNQIDLGNGISIAAPPREPLLFLFREIYIDHCYTPADLTVSQGHAIVDVGAHVGVFALWAAVRFPQASIVALEPSPHLFRYLLRNIDSSRLHNVTAVPCACGAKSGKATLYEQGPEMMNSVYPRDTRNGAPRALADVDILSLDDVFRRYSIAACSLLKLDCEGAEYDILLNAERDTMRRIERIAMEYHVWVKGHSPEELVSQLQSHGFEVVTSPSLVDKEHGYLYAMRRPT